MLYVQDYHTFINEGGAYGHLYHPFEDYSLTFQDLSEMINITVTGAFTPANFTQEKTDGQNLMFSWINGEIRGARTKTHLKNMGSGSLSKVDIAQMFAGRGEIYDAFTNAVDDLEKSIQNLSQKQIEKIFANGKKFMSVEIMTPATQNTIPYGLSMLIFHGTNEYDNEGNLVKQDKTDARILAGMIKQVNQNIQDNFFIRGPMDLKINAMPDTSKKQSYYQNKLKSIVKEFGLSMNNNIQDYLVQKWKVKTRDILNQQKLEYTEDIVSKLAARFGVYDKSYTIPQIKNDLGNEFSEWLKNFEARNGDQIKIWKDYILPIETLFLELGTDILTNIETFLTVDKKAATEEMRSELEKTISDIRKSNDVDAIQKLEYQLKRIDMSGGLERLVPSEGITFYFKDTLYKYTGLFAAINKIGALIRYK